MGLFSFLKSIFSQPRVSVGTSVNNSDDDYYSQFLSDEPVSHDEFYSRLDNAFRINYNVVENYPASNIDESSEYTFDFCLKDGDKVVCCILLLRHNENKTARYQSLSELCESKDIPFVHFYDYYLNKEEYIKERVGNRIK